MKDIENGPTTTGLTSTKNKRLVGIDEISLRDYFAGQALSGLISNGELQIEVVRAQIKRPGQEGFLVGQCLARYSYDLADAMLAARNRTEV